VIAVRPSKGGWRASGTAIALLTAACGGEPPKGVSAEVSETISTVVHVRWSTDDPAVGYVEYGPSPSLEFRTPLEPAAATQHAQVLLGLKADTEYHYRVVVGDESSAIGTIRTGDLPLGMPPLTQGGSEPGRQEEMVLTPVLGASTAVVILDRDGDIVWYHSDDRALDFYRARLSVDRTALLYNAASVSGDPSDASEIVRVALDGSGSTSIAVPLLAHDFVEHPDGTLGTMVVEYGDFEGTTLRGDSIVEIDREGNQTTIWSSWDCFDPADTPGDDIDLGWTFANALDYDPKEGAYYLGMRNFSSIAKIDRATGVCEWVLGLYGGTFDFAPGSARFLHQHQFQLDDSRIVIFDNDGLPGDVSRVLEYELDFDSMVATQVWSYVSDPEVFTFVLGEPIRLGNGDTFITWSAAGQLERVSPEGTSLWKVNSGAGHAFGFATLARDLYGGPRQ
jgi:hypothetical protein